MFAQSRDRTDDLRVTNALLYQLSYLGKKIRKISIELGNKKAKKTTIIRPTMLSWLSP